MNRVPDKRARRPQQIPIAATLTRAALYRLLAQAFTYPAPGHVREMRHGFARLDQATLEQVLARGTMRRVARAANAWRAAAATDLAAEYTHGFLVSAPVSLHETSYGDGPRIGGAPAELADIGGFYAAFGFAPSPGSPDLPDHVASELEFYSLLLVKQAYAEARGWSSRARVSRVAVARFLEQHLGRWVGALRRNVAEHLPGGPHAASAVALDAAVGDECRLLRVAPVPLPGGPARDPVQQEQFVCPRAEADPRSLPVELF